jgi:hypothetical protein
MLRITIHGVVDQPVLALEGCVCGPWVDELETSWRDAVSRSTTGRVHIDLRSVCHVDARGRVLMKAMHNAGAEFITSGIELPEVVRELART